MRIFFCKYNDPPYVKMEKLEVMLRLASPTNAEQLIGELKEYANEVDVDFVRRAVQAIGRCAIKIESAAEQCVNTLLDLLKNKVNYVVQETIVVMKVPSSLHCSFLHLRLFSRIFSASTRIDTSPLFQHCARIWILWMRRMQRPL